MGYCDKERFWITLTVRFAFGFLFLIAALNIFTHHDTKDPPPESLTMYKFVNKSVTGFASELTRPYESTWLNFKWKWWPLEKDPKTNVPVAEDVGIKLVHGFLIGMPFVFTILGFCLLSGLFLYPALRISAIYMVLLGLGKYVSGDAMTAAQDFLFAAFICIGLYMASGERDARMAEATIDIK